VEVRVAFVFGDISLDVERRELRSGPTLVPIEPKVFDLLEFLICNRDRVVSRDDLVAAVWGGRIVSDSAIAVRMNAVRRAIGDDGEHQRYIRTVPRKGFRFVGDVREEPGLAARSASERAAQPRTARHGPRDQTIAFCRTPDGVNLAVASVGQGLPLVSTPTWATHLEHDWQSPARARLWHRLADRFRLIRYDARGFGLSDRDVSAISFTTSQRDLETVVDSLNLHSWPYRREPQPRSLTPLTIRIACRSWCCTAASRAAATGGTPRRMPKWQRRGLPSCARDGATMIRPCSGSSARSGCRARRPSRSSGMQTRCVSRHPSIPPIRSRSVADEIDIEELLPKVSVPTLVLHCRHDNSVPFNEGRRMAALIPNATFVNLDSENHVPLPEEPAWQRFVDEIETFLLDR
jgi:DNA-binding winged helix-turn-helix (wHTH) protein/pimeloyl-ACP methyl ester carboxylesterase